VIQIYKCTYHDIKSGVKTPNVSSIDIPPIGYDYVRAQALQI